MSILGHVSGTRTALLATALVALAAGDALAFGHGGWGSSGSSASYGSYASYSSYGSSSSGSYSSGSSSSGSYGRQGMFARWHARKAARASSGSSSSGSYGSYASYGSSGSSSSGSYGSHGSSSSGSYGTYSAPVEYSDPVEMGVPMESSPTPATPAVPDDATGASIRVTVPADAKVFVNDALTTSTGTDRSYISRGLRSGMSYSYDLRVEFTRDGKPVVENKLVSITAGQEINLAFGNGSATAAAENVATQLTLHVPAEAKVTLAGAATKQTGELRTFSTAGLALGQDWDGYVVRVELMRDGKSVVEEKTLKITGGESYELTFDLDGAAPTMASIN